MREVAKETTANESLELGFKVENLVPLVPTF